MIRNSIKIKTFIRTLTSKSSLKPASYGSNAKLVLGASLVSGACLFYFNNPISLEAENQFNFKNPNSPVAFNEEALKLQKNQEKFSKEHPGVFLWGSNDCGLVAPDKLDETPVKLPRKLAFFENQALRDLHFGRTHAVAVDANGDLYQWGSGYYGNEFDSQSNPEKTLTGKDIVRVRATDNKIFALSRHGTLYVLSALKEYHSPKYNLNSKGWKDYLWLGTSCEVANFQLTLPNVSWGERVVDFATGQHHLSVITSNNRLLTLQADSEGKLYGQLGLSDPESATEPSFGDDNRADYCLQFNEVQLPETFPLNKVACGCNHTFVRTVGGRIFAFGANFVGQLGLGDFTLSRTILMTPQDITEKLPSKSYPEQSKVVDVMAGGDTSAFLVQHMDVLKGTERLELYTCGFGQWGQLGNNRYIHVQGSPVKVQALSGKMEFSEKLNKLIPLRVSRLSIGATHLLAEVESNSESGLGRDVYAWGQNCDYQCGNGKRSNLNTPSHPLIPNYDMVPSNELNLAIQGRMQAASTSSVSVNTPEGKSTRTLQVKQEVVAGFGVSALYSKIVL